MKNSVFYASSIILMSVMFVITVVSVATVRKVAKNSNGKVGNDSIAVSSEKIIYSTNKLLLSRMPEMVCMDIDGNSLLLSREIHEPTFILVLSEDFCSICVEDIIDSFRECIGNRLPLKVIFKDITLRELNFRNEVFSDAECFSLQNDLLELELSSQSLFLLSENLLIKNVILPFSGMSKDAYDVFFHNSKNVLDD